jgi:hypothetical protein
MKKDKKKNIRRPRRQSRKKIKRKQSLKIKGGANKSELKRWDSKSSKKCKDFLQKLSYQSKIIDNVPKDKLKLFSISSLEDNTDLDKLFQELYNCLPVSVSERPLLPALAMFPSTNYTNNLNFDVDDV